MKLKGIDFTIKQIICLFLYYGFAQYLPNSYSLFGGKLSNRIRILLCKGIFKKCGHIRTINRKVNFASGRLIEMGDESGIGANTHIPSDTIIGNHVILSRNCFILDRNHEYKSVSIPINDQGVKNKKTNYY